MSLCIHLSLYLLFCARNQSSLLATAMKLLQFLLLFLFFYFSVALECEYGGSCYIEGNRNFTHLFKQKTCKDACVYFKCHVGNYKIMEGLGCHEDFVNACKYTPPEIKNNIKDYFYVDSSNVYVSCNTSNNCADKAYAALKEKYPKIEQNFQFHPFFPGGNKPESCRYDNSPKRVIYNNECAARKSCSAGKNFIFEQLITANGEEGWTNICDACVFYHCALDNGKTIKSGMGCYENFEYFCKDVLDLSVERKIKENIKDNIFYNKNLVFISCSDGVSCQPDDVIAKINVNSHIVTKFLENIDSTADGNCEDTPLISTSTSLPATTTSHEPERSYNVTLTPPKRFNITLAPPERFRSTASSLQKKTTTFPRTFTPKRPPYRPPFPQHRKFTGECNFGHFCLNIFDGHYLSSSTTKYCSDACVYYRCYAIKFSPGSRRGEYHESYGMEEGYGCFDDFISACKYIGYQTKNKLKDAGSNYVFRSQNLLYISCIDKNGCAKEAVKEMQKKKEIGNGKVHEWNLILCTDGYDFVTSFLKSFRTSAWCKSGRQFYSKEYVKERSSKVKKCYPRISFMCSSDGKLVKGGIGCIEDVEIACKNELNYFLKTKLKQNNGYFFHAEKNIIVSSTKGDATDLKFDYFIETNPDLVKPFYDNIDKNSDEVCDFQKRRKHKQYSPHAMMLSNQLTSFMLNGICLLGLIIINFVFMFL